MNTAIRDQVTGILLAGGAGSRFGHQDKGLINLHGKPFVSHCIDSLVSQLAGIVISCNRNRDEYLCLGYPLCHDKRPVYQGPLAGIEAGLACCKTPYALIYPCDSLTAPNNLVATLTQALVDSNADIAYLNRAEIPQYLIAVMRSDLQASASHFLDQGGRAVRHWYAEHHAIAVDVDCPEYNISNINTPEDLR